ncbi:hypothetical protein Bca52824_086156 [Brassica carinata]|uniref:Uncharacterized protein n=1 Tax=Brassica carinata TaxID=52824 RepID=A0A8X7P935_BRACI|nr:hypothetical protein Bca52824_086156 [Brassica carinata]
MHSLIKLKSQEQKLALPEPALIKEKACYIDDDCDHRERQRISRLTFSRVDSAKHGPVSHTTTDYLARCKIGFTWTENMVTNLGEVPPPFQEEDCKNNEEGNNVDVDRDGNKPTSRDGASSSDNVEALAVRQYDER